MVPCRTRIAPVGPKRDDGGTHAPRTGAGADHGASIRRPDVGAFSGWLRLFPAAPLPLVHLLIEEALQRQRPPRFRATSEFLGLHRALAALFEEAPSHVLPPDLAGLLEQVRRELAERGMALRKDRLAEAAQALGGTSSTPRVVLDGFFTFSADEIRFLEALSRRTRLVVTLPDWPAADPARTGLLQAGFTELLLSGTHRQPRQVVLSAATIEREAEEIARHILEENASGRRFREMGILLRARDPYAPLLETTFVRFGIPARFYLPALWTTTPQCNSCGE